MSGPKGPSEKSAKRAYLLNHGLRNMSMISDYYRNMSNSDYRAMVEAGLSLERECLLALEGKPTQNFEQIYRTKINEMRSILARNGAPPEELTDEYLATMGTPEKSMEAVLSSMPGDSSTLVKATNIILNFYEDVDNEIGKRVARDN